MEFLHDIPTKLFRRFYNRPYSQPSYNLGTKSQFHQHQQFFSFSCCFKYLYTVIWFFFFLYTATLTTHGSTHIPRLGVESEPQMTAYATAIQDLSHVCDLYHSSRQCQTLNPLSRARDENHILTVTSQVHYVWATTGGPSYLIF